MNRRRLILVTLILVIALLAIAGAVLRSGSAGAARPDGPPGATSAPTSQLSIPSLVATNEPGASLVATNEPGASLIDLLGMLPVKPEKRAGYDRSLFVLWIDADGDGCDTRREVLIDEAIVAPVVSADCHLTGGRWHSVYDGVETTDPGIFDVDHVVPLAEAWDSGAFAWTAERRMAYANDLGVPWSLLAVSASSNRAKADRDPAEWMPWARFRCAYVADWLAVKVRWSLAIDRREGNFLDPIARACSDRRPMTPAP